MRIGLCKEGDKLGLADGKRRFRVGQEPGQQLRRRLWVEQDRDKSTTNRSEEGRRVAGSVIQKQGDPVSTLQAKCSKGLTPLSSGGTQLGIGPGTCRTNQRQGLRVAVQVVPEDSAAVRVQGPVELDLLRSGGGAHRIGNPGLLCTVLLEACGKLRRELAQTRCADASGARYVVVGKVQRALPHPP